MVQSRNIDDVYVLIKKFRKIGLFKSSFVIYFDDIGKFKVDYHLVFFFSAFSKLFIIYLLKIWMSVIKCYLFK